MGWEDFGTLTPDKLADLVATEDLIGRSMKVTISRKNEIRECVGMNKEAVDAVTLGFTRLVEGKVSQPPTIRMDVEANQGEVDIKTAYIEGLDHFASAELAVVKDTDFDHGYHLLRWNQKSPPPKRRAREWLPCAWLEDGGGTSACTLLPDARPVPHPGHRHQGIRYSIVMTLHVHF
jgi:hypothetical protein